MIDLDGEKHSRIVNPYDEPSGSRYIYVIMTLMFLAVVGAIGYHMILGRAIPTVFSTTPQHDFSRVYASMNVPPIASPPQDAYDGLLRLETSTCNEQAIYKLAEAMVDIDKRWAADAYVGHANKCGPVSAADLRRAANLYYQISEYQLAINATDGVLSSAYPDEDTWYIRAQSEFALRRFDDAINDYQKTIAILSPSKTNSGVFFNLAEAQVAKRAFCDAAKTMQSFIDTHGDNSEVPRARTVAADFRVKGHCGNQTLSDFSSVVRD